MNFLRAIFMLVLSLLASHAAALDLKDYQQADGAITVYPRGDYVDPYFAIKALWAARQLGDTAPAETLAWIRWLLPRQLADGRFLRYCRTAYGWRSCASADADDALLAMWIELLQQAAPDGQTPPDWVESQLRAARLLERLRDPATGVYRVSQRNRSALLMDNSEIYSALDATGKSLLARGNPDAAEYCLKRAESLRAAMERVFPTDEAGILHWSYPYSADPFPLFYPYQVAHLFPLLHDMAPLPGMLSWPEWLNRYGEEWISLRSDNYPWGLVALLAYRYGSNDVVARWLSNATFLRGASRGNVLEESVWQSLSRASHKQGTGAP